MRRPALLLIAQTVLLLAACAGTTEVLEPSATSLAPPPAVVQRSLENLTSGEVADWTDAAGRGGGTVQPLRTFRTESGFCREYALTVRRTDGSGHVWREVACRDPAGVWRTLVIAA